MYSYRLHQKAERSERRKKSLPPKPAIDCPIIFSLSYGRTWTIWGFYSWTIWQWKDTRRDQYRSKAIWCTEVLRYDGEEVLCGAQPSKKKSSFRFSFRSSTRSRRLPRKTIKLAIVECETQWKVWNVFICIFLKPRALFPAFIVVLYKYQQNKQLDYSVFPFWFKKQKNAVYLFIPFALFPFQNQIRKNKKRLCYLVFLILF